MKYLFRTAISHHDTRTLYCVYEFKLMPNRFKAIPVRGQKKRAREFELWKAKDNWVSSPKSAESIATVVGRELDRRRK